MVDKEKLYVPDGQQPSQLPLAAEWLTNAEQMTLQMIYKQLLNLTENGIIEEMTEDTIPREWQQAYEDSEQGEHTDPEKLLAAVRMCHVTQVRRVRRQRNDAKPKQDSASTKNWKRRARILTQTKEAAQLHNQVTTRLLLKQLDKRKKHAQEPLHMSAVLWEVPQQGDQNV